MGDERRPGRGRDRRGGRPRAAVAEVDGDAEGVHPGHGLASELADPGIPRLEAPVANQIAGVVGQLDDEDAELAEGVEPAEVALDHLGVLEAQDQAERAVLAGARDVVVPAHDRQELRVLRRLAGPQRDVPHRGFEVVGADGDVEGGQPALGDVVALGRGERSARRPRHVHRAGIGQRVDADGLGVEGPGRVGGDRGLAGRARGGQRPDAGGDGGSELAAAHRHGDSATEYK